MSPLRPAHRQALVPGKARLLGVGDGLGRRGLSAGGGRLDYVEDTPAAALVYRRAQHVVNLFVWPSKRRRRAAAAPLAARLQRVLLAKDGMHYWAVSDLNEAELQKFVELVRRQG